MFGENNYFLEIQNHGMPEEQVVTDGCRTLSAQLGIEKDKPDTPDKPDGPQQ